MEEKELFLCGPVITDKATHDWIGAQVATNNTGELIAIFHALRWAQHNARYVLPQDKLVIHYDSTYACEMTLGKSKPDKNLHLVNLVQNEFIKARAQVAIAFEHVFSHLGKTDAHSIGNDRADYNARFLGAKGKSKFALGDQ